MTDGPAQASPARAQRDGDRPASDPRLAAGRMVAGVLVLFLALLLFAGSRLAAAGQRHSYDPGAAPAPTYRLVAGKTYQLSSPAGVAALKKSGVLDNVACFSSGDSQLQNPLSIVATMDDPRDLRVFATFRAGATGDQHISCNGVDSVFVDDAEGSPLDYNGLLVLLSVVVGLVGAVLTVSAAERLLAQRADAMPAGSEPSGADSRNGVSLAGLDFGGRSGLEFGEEDE